MSDPLKRILPGDPLPDSSRTWNALVEAARTRQNSATPLPSGGPIRFKTPETDVGLEHRLLYFNFAGHVASAPLVEIETSTLESPYTFSLPFASIRYHYSEILPAGVSDASWDYEIYRFSTNSVSLKIYLNRKSSSGVTIDRNVVISDTSIEWDRCLDTEAYTVTRLLQMIISFPTTTTLAKLIVSNRDIWLLPRELFVKEYTADPHYLLGGTNSLGYGDTANGVGSDDQFRAHGPCALIDPDPAVHYGFDSDSFWLNGPAKLLRFLHRGVYRIRLKFTVSLSGSHFDSTPIIHDGDTVANVISVKQAVVAGLDLHVDYYTAGESIYASIESVGSLPETTLYTVPDGGSLPSSYDTFIFEKDFAIIVDSNPVDVSVVAANSYSGDPIDVNFSGTVTASLVLGGRIANEKTFLTGGSEGPAPISSRTPATLTAEADVGTSPPSDSFHVSNAGGGTLSYDITCSETWLLAVPSSGTSTGESDLVIVNYSTTSLAIGTYTATITINSNASNSPQTVEVSLEITTTGTAPHIVLDPTSFELFTSVGVSPGDEEFELDNSGTSTLLYSITCSEAWLSVSPTSGSSDGTPYMITVSFDTASLGSGGYTADIIVTGNASNSPQVITVSVGIAP